MLAEPAFAGAAVAPLLKWPGGKGAELGRILPAAPARADRYLEPFLGGGAVLFAVSPVVPAYVNDVSADLMTFYAAVREQDDGLFELLDAIAGWWRALEAFTAAHGDALVELFSSRTGGDVAAAAAGIVDDRRRPLLATVPRPWHRVAEEFHALALASVPRKVARMRQVEVARGVALPPHDVWRNVEGAFKAACYTALRSTYNAGSREGDTPQVRAALYFFLREYSYAAMFRFNARGEFNVPYGGISYNRKELDAKIAHLRSDAVVARLSSAHLSCEDFEDFLDSHDPAPGDFCFLDPPYDSDFSAYDGNSFGMRDHARLAAFMARTRCRFQLVVKSTPAVRELYAHRDWHVIAFDKRYTWTIKERNDRNATHLMITNYEPAPPAPCPT